MNFTKHIDGDSDVSGSFLAVPSEFIEISLNSETHPETRLSLDMKTIYLCEQDQDLLFSKLDRMQVSYRIEEVVTKELSFIRHLSPAAWV